MRRALVVASLLAPCGAALIAALVDRSAQARGDDDPDEREQAPAPPAIDGVPLVTPGATFAWVVAEAMPLSRQVGPVALGALDLALGRRDRGVSIAGDAPVGRPPSAWPLALGDLAGRGPAPLGASAAGATCDCATRIGEVGERRVATLWATTRFRSDDGGAGLVILDVRARYRDGIAVWINGVEVARRALSPTAGATAFAERSHGPEWETFHVPVVPGLLRRGDNVVAAVVHAAAASAAPSFDLEIVGHRGARVVRGPMLQRVGTDRASIVFDTDLPVRGAVELGATGSLGRRVSSGFLPRRRHVVELDHLTPGPVYYRVVADGGTGPVHVFHTAPGRGDVIRIAAYGDVRGGHQTHGDLIKAMRAESPDLVVATGDLVLRGSDEADWQRFFAVTADLVAEVPFYPAIGNHDLGTAGDDARKAIDLFAVAAFHPMARAPSAAIATATTTAAADAVGDRRFYGFDVGPVHVAVLDSNAYGRKDQLAWLDADLGAARQRGARALLVMTHDGPFSRGIHGGNAIAQRDYVPLLVRHRVTLLLSGHDHLYMRGQAQGLDYVVTGGGGADLYPITCGVPGRPRCAVDDGMRFAAREHHYVMLTVYPTWLELCARRSDGSALEPCVRYDLAP